MSITQKIFQLRSYIQYWLAAVNQHSLHPPFVYQLYTRAIKPDTADPSFVAIEQQRKVLLKNNSTIRITELGAGSSVNRRPARAISDIARNSLTTPAFSRLLYRLISYMQASTILELGTSLGINTLYLAAAAPQGQVYTLEGCPHTAAIARQLFKDSGVENIKLLEGSIDETLPLLLQQEKPRIDAAYLDANHTYEASIRYFEMLLPFLHERSFLVFDDIYWSEGMQQAWQEMRQHPRVSLSLDLYDAGILFFQPGLQPAHYVLEY